MIKYLLLYIKGLQILIPISVLCTLLLLLLLTNKLPTLFKTECKTVIVCTFAILDEKIIILNVVNL